ncbi:glycoside hydrolase family 78 protein [Paenibacillus sp. SYP-B4298]|uniref:glycoside hydrolase family 78 protein n=1 Tax=Paenibacillus sp. SYP-B4298 TaxID=2996034 RepID=UPI0022DD8B5E|nr:glycoside hydrolase family 78 protein [Paenibacillus sp. SYP-B4298]
MKISVTKLEYNNCAWECSAGHPRFSWVLEAEGQRQRQSAYRILVATSAALLAQEEPDLWDSGKVESEQSVFVPYAGADYASQRVCWWKVKVWDQDGQESAWSEAGSWFQGGPESWQGRWIGRTAEPGANGLLPSPYIRREFILGQSVKRAVIYATALGLYELRLNGQRVTDALFLPGWTDYNVRTQVQAFDVSGLLQAGENALGVILGTGWYAGYVGMNGKNIYGDQPQLLVQLEVELADGTYEILATDERWRTAIGPIHYSDLIKGETFDASAEWAGWDRPGFLEDGWQAAELFPDYKGELVVQAEPPIRVTEERRSVKTTVTADGASVLDMGQNMVGWARLNLATEPGDEITVRYAEMLNEDGTLYTANLRKAEQVNRYIARGGENEQLEPHFTFHGFRYIELSGYRGELTEDSVIGLVVHSDMQRTGSLETSDPMVNRLFQNIVWGLRGNYLSVPTDCPQRDERLGWTGDAQIFVRTASYIMNVSRFFHKYMIDITDTQQPNGAFPDVAPDGGWLKFKETINWFASHNAGWGDAGVVIPWTMYLAYGDRAILERHYDSMAAWIDYLKEESDGLLGDDRANYGDWLSIAADTPKDVLATAYFAYSTKLMAKIAGVLGKEADQQRYVQLFNEIAQAFTTAYVDAEGHIKGDTQTVYVLALYFGLLDGELHGKAAARLKQRIADNDGHLSTGFLGVGYLLPALSDNGMQDIAYSLLHKDTFPSWLYSVKHGATTIWERWDGWTDHNGFQDPHMNSFNHYSLGSVGEWMFRYMLGIEADEQQPGFKHAVIRPQPGGKLSHARGTYDTPYGRYAVRWEQRGGQLELEVTVPVNATATVHLPGKALKLPALAELAVATGNTAYGSVGAGEEQAARSVEASRSYDIGSGVYRFVCAWE